MVKVRSPRWQKKRMLKLKEDGVTVWCQSHKMSSWAKEQKSFNVMDVECIQEGCQSETLRRMAGSVPEDQCLTVVFKGSRKSLDLLCESQEEARHWVRGIHTLQERLKNMNQKDKLDHWIRTHLSKADQNHDNKMSYEEVQKLLQMINVDLSDQALNQGCRCVELDCWDGDKGEPVIYHGHTFTSKVDFVDVIETINEYAFKASPYPLILSLENHCSREQQMVMARHLRSILGDKLVTKPLKGLDSCYLPSPEDLKGRILVKGKKGKTQEQCSSSSSDLSSSEEEASQKQAKPKTNEEDKPGVSRRSPELSELVVYTRSVPFKSFELSAKSPATDMSSFPESVALRLIKDSGTHFIRHNSHQLSRIYPSSQRLGSSNYNPQEMWNAGCQIVALNFQTPGEQMDLNQGRFRQNGLCGYVLKPPFMCQPDSVFNPENVGGGPGHRPVKFTVQIISAQQLPKPEWDKPTSIVDPQVRVEIHGVPIDNMKKETPYVGNNGFNPRWDCTFNFMVHAPDLALVRFVVEDHDFTSSNDFLGQYTLPFSSLRTGYRHVPLLKLDGSSLSPASLFIHVKVTPC
uniref:Phosphoinositide phospholipase C n=1 Tax=Nothobranchius kadleci TaxID=1051664 RepID=A0A1A8BAZ2_NOTKA